jgi:hypothetical protein
MCHSLSPIFLRGILYMFTVRGERTKEEGRKRKKDKGGKKRR